MHRRTSPAQRLGRPVRVLMLLTSLHGGGAERVAVQLHNQLDPERFDVRTGLLRAAGPYLDQIDAERVMVAADGEERFNYDGPNRAQYTPAKVLGAIQRAPLAYRKMIAEFRPDVVMSFLKGTNLLTWLALMNSGKRRPRWIAREGNNVRAVVREEAPNALVEWGSLRLTRRAYRRADAVLANSTDMAAGLAADLGLDPDKLRMINNPIDLAAIEAATQVSVAGAPERPYILTAGRLEYQKAQEILLQAYARSGIWRSHELVILGKGSTMNCTSSRRSWGWASMSASSASSPIPMLGWRGRTSSSCLRAGRAFRRSPPRRWPAALRSCSATAISARATSLSPRKAANWLRPRTRTPWPRRWPGW